MTLLAKTGGARSLPISEALDATNCGSLSLTTLLTVDRGSESTVSVLLTESGAVREEALDIKDAVVLAFPCNRHQ